MLTCPFHWISFMNNLMVLHKLSPIRSSTSGSAPAETGKPNILLNVFSEIPCCSFGQNIKLSWSPNRTATTDNDDNIRMHAEVYELLKDLSVTPSRISGLITKDQMIRDEKKLIALRTLHEITASQFKENR